jgi:hypothetical protein
MAEEAGGEEEEEEEEEDDNLLGSTDPESAIDRREEENFKYNQQIPYKYTVSWALKTLIKLSPFLQKAVKWQGKVGED